VSFGSGSSLSSLLVFIIGFVFIIFVSVRELPTVGMQEMYA
jgi:hypothetical protein